MGLYGTRGLNLAKMRAIDQTLPDALAPLVKTQQNIAAVLDPLNPSGRDLAAQGPLDKKVRDSFAGVNDLVMPGGSRLLIDMNTLPSCFSNFSILR